MVRAGAVSSTSRELSPGSRSQAVAEFLRKLGRSDMTKSSPPRFPEYRRHSPLRRLAEGPLWKRELRSLTTRVAPPGDDHPDSAGATGDASRHRSGRAAATLLRARTASLSAEARSRRQARGGHCDRVRTAAAGALLPSRRTTGSGRRSGADRHARQVQGALGLLGRLDYTPISARGGSRGAGRPSLSFPKRPVLLTFDDAYADLNDHAFPALGSKGYCATLPLRRLDFWTEITGTRPCTRVAHVSHRLLDLDGPGRVAQARHRGRRTQPYPRTAAET